MVGSISGANNLINMISFSYQQSTTQQSPADSQELQGAGTPPPPPPIQSNNSKDDPLGVFNIVDSDSDNSISETEHNILSEGILEITGSELNNNFLDFDSDGDGVLNGSELRSVLDEAGFEPPPPPPQQVIAAYEAQSGENSTYNLDGESLLVQLLEYLETRSVDFDITA